MDSLWAVVLERCIYYAVVSLIPLLITVGVTYGAKLGRKWQVVACAICASLLTAIVLQNWRSERIALELSEGAIAMAAICSVITLLIFRRRLRRVIVV